MIIIGLTSNFEDDKDILSFLPELKYSSIVNALLILEI